jgi:hypothetical protein
MTSQPIFLFSTNTTICPESLHDVLRLLIETDQIPPEKQVAEEGTKWPVKLYRRKEAQEMVSCRLVQMCC